MSFFKRLTLAFKAWQADKAPRLGASLAYYAIFSLAPLLVVAVGIAGIVLQDSHAQATVIAQAGTLVGPSGATLIRQLLGSVSHRGGNIFAITIGVATTLLGALGIFSQLRDALDTIWQDKVASGGIKNTVGQYVASFVLMLGVSALLLLSLAVGTLLSQISGPSILWQLIGLLISFGLTVLLFGFLLRTASSRRPSWRVVWPSAALTAALFTLGKYLLGFYLSHSGVASAYGAAGSLAVMLLWLYYSAQIILFGAEYLRILEQPVVKNSLLQQIVLLGLIPLARRFLRRR